MSATELAVFVWLAGTFGVITWWCVRFDHRMERERQERDAAKLRDALAEASRETADALDLDFTERVTDWHRHISTPADPLDDPEYQRTCFEFWERGEIA